VLFVVVSLGTQKQFAFDTTTSPFLSTNHLIYNHERQELRLGRRYRRRCYGRRYHCIDPEDEINQPVTDAAAIRLGMWAIGMKELRKAQAVGVTIADCG